MPSMKPLYQPRARAGARAQKLCYPPRPMSSNAGMSASQNSPAALPLPSPLSIRDFRVYWIGQFVSLVGMWTQMVAQGLVITRLTRSASIFAWISFLSSIPMALLIMPAGVVADRFDRRKILIVTQMLLAGVAFLYAGLVMGGQLTLGRVELIAMGAGVIAAFDFPAQSAIVPQLVPPPMIPRAIALNQAIFHGSRFLGPMVAALLIWLVGPSSAFLANGLSYFAVIYSLLIIKSRVIAKTAAADAGPAAVAGAVGAKLPRPKRQGGMGEGFAYVRKHPVVLALIGLTALVTMFAMPVNIVFMPLICKQVFHASDAELGIVMGGSGLGAVVGTLLMMRVPAIARGKAIMVAVVSATLGLITLSFMHSPYTAALVMLVTSGSTALAMGLSATTIQVIVPDALRGRVMGIYGMTFVAIMPPFSLLWGLVGDATSLHTLVRALGIAFGTTALSLLAATRIWRMNPTGAAAESVPAAPPAAAADAG
jgi:MFS family permease